MQSSFLRALALVLQHEGGYVNHPDDPGGATNRGITLQTFRHYYGRDQTVDDLRQLTTAQATHIYKMGYWAACACDTLPAGIDYVVFDQAVNSGPRQSVKWLQAAVGGVVVDGVLGPRTLAAVRDSDTGPLIHRMCDTRLGFLRRLQGGKLWKTFGRGWEARVASVRTAGVAMAQPPKPSPDPYAILTIRLPASVATWYATEAAATGFTSEQLIAIVLAEHYEWQTAYRTTLLPGPSCGHRPQDIATGEDGTAYCLACERAFLTPPS